MRESPDVDNVEKILKQLRATLKRLLNDTFMFITGMNKHKVK